VTDTTGGHSVPHAERDETLYRMEDDIELLADRYLRKTVHDPGASQSGESALLSKRQVAALIRDAWVAGYTDGRKVPGPQR